MKKAVYDPNKMWTSEVQRLMFELRHEATRVYEMMALRSPMEVIDALKKTTHLANETYNKFIEHLNSITTIEEDSEN